MRFDAFFTEAILARAPFAKPMYIFNFDSSLHHEKWEKISIFNLGVRIGPCLDPTYCTIIYKQV